MPVQFMCSSRAMHKLKTKVKFSLHFRGLLLFFAAAGSVAFVHKAHAFDDCKRASVRVRVKQRYYCYSYPGDRL